MTAEPFRRIEIDSDVHRALTRARRSLGESENDILRRLLLAPGAGPSGRPAASAGTAHPAASAGTAHPAAWAGAAHPAARRSRGLWSVEIAGRRWPAANLKQAYRLLLRELDAAYPHFLEDFAREKGRARRFVARAPADLYGRSPHLARHAEPLCGGWYFDTNLSAAQIARRARIAARLCGLFYGFDVRILDNQREI